MRFRASLASIWAVIMVFALAAPAYAAKGGEGLYGKTTDKTITYAGFILIVGFTLLVTSPERRAVPPREAQDPQVAGPRGPVRLRP